MIERFNGEFIAEVKRRWPSVIVRESTFISELDQPHGWGLEFTNGFVASIQFAPSSYSNNRVSMFAPARPKQRGWVFMETAITAEAAGWFGTDREWIMFSEHEYSKEQTVTEALAWIAKHAPDADA